jgi:hypothetical protein
MSQKDVCDGNSLTRGAGATAGHDYPTILGTLRAGETIVNLGVDGATTTDRSAAYPAGAATIFTAGAFYVPWEVINAVYFNVDAPTAYSDYAAWCNLARATGYKVIAVTGSPARGDFPGTSTLPAPQETNWNSRIATVNANIRANWRLFSHGLYDLALDTRFQNYNDTTYFQTDKVHYTDLGYAIVAAGVSAAITTVLTATTGHFGSVMAGIARGPRR